MAMPTTLDLSLEIPDRLLSELDRLQPDIPPTCEQPASVDDIFEGLLMGFDGDKSEKDCDQSNVNLIDSNVEKATRTVTQLELFGPEQQVEMDHPAPVLAIMAEDESTGSENEIIHLQDIHLNSNKSLRTEAKVDELSTNLQNRFEEVQTMLQMQFSEMQQRFQQQFNEVLSAIHTQTIIITNKLIPVGESSTRERATTGDRRDISTQTEDVQNSLDGDQVHVRLYGKRKIESSQFTGRDAESMQRRKYKSSVVTRSEAEINVDFDANGLVNDTNVVVDNRHPKLILNIPIPNVAAVDESSELPDTDRCKLDSGIQENSKGSDDESMQVGVRNSLEINLRKQVNNSSEIHRTVQQDSEVPGSMPVQPELVNGEILTRENSDSDPDGQSNARVHERLSVCTQSDEETVIVNAPHPLKGVTSLQIPTFSDKNSKESGASALNQEKVPPSQKRKNIVNSIRKQSKKYCCLVCNKQCASYCKLILHLRIHTGEKPFKCQTCDACFSYKSNLARHLWMHTGEKPFKCQTCGARFSQSSSLATHLRIHTGEKPFKCQTCGARFRQSSNLATHLRIHSGEKPFKCQTCGARFSQSSSLARHLRIHTGEKPFKCQTCGARFSQSSSLATHLRIHTGEKPFKCQTCDACFSYKSNLARHLWMHTGEKPFKCQTCGARFSQSSSLATHLRIHTGEKTFKCQTCDACFSQSSSLATHLRIHTDEKPFECYICKKAFGSKRTLSSHLNIHSS